MKNKIYKSLLLGISSAVVASASYALITPANKVKSADIDLFSNNRFFLQRANTFDNGFGLDENKSDESSEFNSIEHIIKSGENLSSIFSKLNLSKSDLHKIIRSDKKGKEFKTITSGKTLEVTTTRTGELKKISYKKSAMETVTATRDDFGFKVEISSKKINKEISSAIGTIHSSLYLDGKESGLPDKIIMQLADIFAWDIDFALDIHENDNFAVLYERHFVDGKEIAAGDILAAEFVNKGKTYQAVRYEDKQGNINYLTPDGRGMRKAFIRTPVDFIRISSPFDLKRKHPVLNRIRAHKGVDYAARTGTPVKSTGDGKITFQGRQNGYGRVVIIQHGKRYSTLYAHLSAFSKNYKQGSNIRQGDTVGYVGQSGLASGPHLHYEFRVDGEHRDPLTVALPDSTPIDSSSLAHFLSTTQPLMAELNQVKATILVANKQ